MADYIPEGMRLVLVTNYWKYYTENGEDFCIVRADTDTAYMYMAHRSQLDTHLEEKSIQWLYEQSLLEDSPPSSSDAR